MAHYDIIAPVEATDSLPTVHKVTAKDLKDALAKGFEDFWAMPSHVIFICWIYPNIGILLARAMFGLELVPLIYPIVTGFALVGPFAAIGLYELSRRREQTAGLLMARFDHHTSRDLDPQLHSHVFVLNLAPRKDGTWGAIISRELYKAQKEAGAVYRQALAAELEREGHAVERSGDSFRMRAIPRDIERAFSKRRQAIEAAAEAHGYKSAKGMELAALRTRRAKRDVQRDALFETWRAEARARGFEMRRETLARSPEPRPAVTDQPSLDRQSSRPAIGTAPASQPGPHCSSSACSRRASSMPFSRS